ncbi:MAG: hypothetical protein ACYCVL_08970 [Gemmatimonadaceae bacterium]
MPGQFIPADHSRGDANTLGGYMAVHDRPAAFEGSDGFSYSVEIVTDAVRGPAGPSAAYLLFVQWARVGAAAPQGHLETDYLAHAATPDAARALVGAMPLADVKRALDGLIAARDGAAPGRRWWDAMRADDGEK